MRIRFFAVGALAAALPSLIAAADERTVFVSVVDDRGAPVPDLSVEDFVVREDGTAREVLRVGRATEPMQIAVLVDNSAASSHATAQIRDGLRRFIDALAGRNEMALLTVGERPTIVADYTSDAPPLKRAVDRIFARPDSGMYLLDAIVDAARGLQKKEPVESGSSRTLPSGVSRTPPRRHIVTLTTEGVEFSNRHYETVFDELYRSGATMHALVLTTVSAPNLAADEIRNRNVVVGDGPAKTGGRRETLLAESAIEPMLAALAREMTSQYRVVYGRPDTLIPPEKLEVSVRRRGLTVRARTRAGR
jgi:VWFA-related protein